MEQTSSRDSDSSTSTPTKPSSSELSTVRKGTQTSYENRRRNSCIVVMCYVIKDIHDRWEFPIYGIAIRQRVCMYVCMYVCIEITGLYFAAVWSVRQRGCRAPPPKLCMTVSNIYALRNLSIQTNVCIGNVYVDQLLLRHGARFSLVDHGCGVEMAALNTESAYKHTHRY